MRSLVLSALHLLTIIPASYGQVNLQHEQIKPYVIDFLKRIASSSASCDLFKDFLAKDPSNENKKKMMFGFCDSDIDFSKPISFSEMSTHHFEGANYVCGIISGRTKINQRIGARFISAEPYHLILNVKYSRRPIAYTTDDKYLVYEYQLQVKSFNELNKKYCQ
ncbi:Uncharacterised protein [Yersinia intermedia]|uniref:hypothetical protein n=1 Tax=Yersinia intermedia TaxID=631 RepID=UPI0005EA283A|nr:hypothetical protein [Yersinia intermedia]WET14966.1 hypothetical protein P2W49_21985 [Yersinia intermedia]CQJ67443.1 Uncharacterised protein [Yersinia intermedia]